MAEKVKEFVTSTKEIMSNYEDECIYNTDQSGFTKELHSQRYFPENFLKQVFRSLDYTGVKHVKAIVGSPASLTHSFTIQPMVSKAGVPVEPCLLVLQESKDLLKTGDYGPIIQKNIFKV